MCNPRYDVKLGVTRGPGDILLFYNPRGVSRLISTFTRSPFYHVALYAGAGNVIEAIPSGVVFRAINAGARRRHFAVIPAPDDSGRRALDWARTKVGDGYDPRNALGLVLDRVFAHLHVNYAAGDRYTCGEFVAQAFKEAGTPLFDHIDPEDVIPADFEKFLEGSPA